MSLKQKIIQLMVALTIPILLVIAFIPYSLWVLLALALFMVFAMLVQRLKRYFELRRYGYFVGFYVGLGPIYEEKLGNISRLIQLKTISLGHGGGCITIPTQQEWKSTAPEWARGKRDEIFTRAIVKWPKVRVDQPADWVRSIKDVSNNS